MSEIDINKMVEKAKRRKQWSVSKSENAPPAVLDGKFWLVACDVQRNNAAFIAQAPATILALHQQVQDLQAANAALQTQVGVWQEVDVKPSLHLDPTNFYVSDELQLLCVANGGLWGGKEGIHSRFIAEDIVEVIGWRPLPDESPTAESEE